MDVRAIAIVGEIVILSILMFCMLRGVGLTVYEVGLGVKYRRIVTTALVLIGSVSVLFFVAHLISFYPK